MMARPGDAIEPARDDPEHSPSGVPTDQAHAAAGDEEPSRPQPGPPIRTAGLPAEQNRGRRAPEEGSGVVVGSGAAAGGGGGAEDHDSDPQAGDGAVHIKHAKRRPAKGGDAPVGGSR